MIAAHKKKHNLSEDEVLFALVTTINRDLSSEFPRNENSVDEIKNLKSKTRNLMSNKHSSLGLKNKDSMVSEIEMPVIEKINATK